ncbi:CHD3-type chromatin-remodeling factor PICKLE [Fagus crenata]
MPSVIADKCMSFREGFSIVFKWFGAKGLTGLMDLLDKGTGFTWRPYSNFVSGFTSRSPLLLVHASAIGAFELREGDITRISYLASVRARWLPAWSPHEIKYVAYCTHRVPRQFGFDQDIPRFNLEVLGSDHYMDPYLKGKAYAFYSSKLPRIRYPKPSRVGASTKRMHDYWTRVMRVFVEYVKGRTSSDIPMPGLCVEPPSKFRILRNVASWKGYDSRQGAGYVEWHEHNLSWKVYRTYLPPKWASTHSTFIKDE